MIFLKKELDILLKLRNADTKHTSKLIYYDIPNKTIIMTYKGESLFTQFTLPSNWKKQIKMIFHELTTNNIYYPEFNLKNILYLNESLCFIDFGLAKFKFEYNVDLNKSNCDSFIKTVEYIK